MCQTVRPSWGPIRRAVPSPGSKTIDREREKSPGRRHCPEPRVRWGGAERRHREEWVERNLHLYWGSVHSTTVCSPEQNMPIAISSYSPCTIPGLLIYILNIIQKCQIKCNIVLIFTKKLDYRCIGNPYILFLVQYRTNLAWICIYTPNH